MASDEQPCNGSGGDGGGEGNNHQDNDHAADNGHITVCHRCRRDYFANGNPANPDAHYLGTLPTGYRFSPTDEELLEKYLLNKIKNLMLPPNNIVCEKIYDYHPADLIEKYRRYGEREWYFFSTRDRKYPNGIRPDRAAGEVGHRVGYWKATGADKNIEIPKGSGRLAGYKKALVFYEGSNPREGLKTDWIMHEYRALNKEEEDRKKGKIVLRIDKKKAGADEEPIDMKLDDYVLCRIYQKPSKDSSRFETPNQRAESEGLEIDSNNGDDGDQVVVASPSSPIQQNKRMRTSRAPNGTNAANTYSSSLIAQTGIQDGMVNNSNGIYGNNTGNFLPMLVDLPYPLRTLPRPPSNFHGSNHQKQPMQPPSNLCNPNHQQQQHMPVQPHNNFSNLNQQHHQHMQQPSNFYYSLNQQLHQMEMFKQELEFQNPFDFSRNSNFEIGESSTTQAHCPPPHHPWSTPYNTAPVNYSPHSAAVFSNFLPPNHHLHPSINNDHLYHIPPGFGFLSNNDPGQANSAASLDVPPLDSAYPDQHPVIESPDVDFLLNHEFPPEVADCVLNPTEDEKTDEEAEKSS